MTEAPRQARSGTGEVPSLAAAIRHLRQDLGLTQEDFAQRLGVRVATVNRWESGKVAPSRLAIATLARVAKEEGRIFP